MSQDIYERIAEQRPGDKHIDLGNFNRLVGKTNATGRFIENSDGIQVAQVTGVGLAVVRRPPPTPPIPESKRAFGFSIYGQVVTIYGGEFQLGDNTPVAVGDATRTISNDHEYIGVEYTYDTQVLTIGSPTTSKPVPDGSVYRVWLWQFRLFDGVRVDLEKEGKGHGNILAPALPGDA